MQYEDVQRRLEEIQRPRKLRALGWKIFLVMAGLSVLTFGLAFIAGTLFGAGGFLLLLWLSGMEFAVGGSIAWVLLVRARWADLKIRRGL